LNFATAEELKSLEEIVRAGVDGIAGKPEIGALIVIEKGNEPEGFR